jgi:hypothetical protein
MTDSLQTRLYKLKKYLRRGYAAAVCKRMEKKDIKISIHMLYKIAAGKVYYEAALQELITYAQEEKARMKNLEKQIDGVIRVEEMRS